MIFFSSSAKKKIGCVFATLFLMLSIGACAMPVLAAEATTPQTPAAPKTDGATDAKGGGVSTTKAPQTPGLSAADAQTIAERLSCSFWNIPCLFANLMYQIMTLFAWLLGAIALLFSATVYYTVVHLGALVSGLTSITTAWGILRSMANIALLFTFILIGVATVLDVEQYGVKKLLPRLLIAALLLNFSLFITKGIIDIGDTFAVQFYKEINGGNPGAPTFSIQNEPISEAFMDATNLRSVYSGVLTPGGLQVAKTIDYSTIVLISFLGIILFSIAAFVFLSLSVMFVARVVTLIFLMIVSPVGFIASAIPGLGSQGDKWWKMLMNNVLFAPLVMLCILISISMLQHGLGTALGVASGAAAGGAQVGGAGFTGVVKPTIGDLTNWSDLLLVFAIAAGFMMASLVIARQLSVMGANFAMNASRKIVTYPFAFAARNTVGRGAASLGKWYSANIGKLNEGKGKTAKTASWLLRNTGIDEGIAGALKATAGAKVGGFSSYTDRQKEMAERKKEVGHAAEAAKLKDALAGNNKDLAEELANKMNLHGIETEIGSMGEKQLAMLAQVLSPEKFSKLMDSKEVSEDVKETMRHNRFDDVVNGRKDAKDLGTEDLVQLSKFNRAFFTDLITGDDGKGKSLLKEDQLDAIGKNKDVSDELRKSARDNMAARRADIHIESGRMKEAEDLLDNMTGKQKAAMKQDSFIDASGNVRKNIVNKLTLNDFSTLMQEGKLTSKGWEAVAAEGVSTHRSDPAWASGFEKNQLLAQQMGWTKSSRQIELLEQIVAKL